MMPKIYDKYNKVVVEGGNVEDIKVTLDSETIEISGTVNIGTMPDIEFPEGGGLTEDELRAKPIEVTNVVESQVLLPDESIDISYAMDKTHNMPLYTEVANVEKRDQFGAIIPSDAPNQIIWNSVVAAQALVIDTTGYGSIVIQKTTAGIITPYTSNDGQVWYGVMGYLSSTPQTFAATMPTGLGVYIFPVHGRYFKLVGPASAVQCIIYLRTAPVVPLGTIGTVSTVTSLSQLAGTAIVTGGVAGSLGVGGAVATGVVPTSNPVPIGGVDAGRLYTPSMVAANLTPKTRRALIDEQGRFIPPNIDLPLNGNQNIQGTATANVRDVDVSEGQTQLDLLWQILVELKVLNHQMSEMAKGSSLAGDDLESLRTNFEMYNYNT
jgi:hypothetical protein